MKNKPKFTAVKEVKRRARIAVGRIPRTKVIPDKRRRPPKHKQAEEYED